MQVFVEGDAGTTINVINPATGEVQESAGRNVCSGSLSSPIQSGELVLAACEPEGKFKTYWVHAKSWVVLDKFLTHALSTSVLL